MNDVTKTIVAQVCEQVFVKKGKVFLVDDATVRFNFGRTNVDVHYDAGLDLYDVTTHKMGKGYDATSDTVNGVYADMLGECFPKHVFKDANVRGMFAMMREAR
jgi:prophage maintenance system killer protein